MRKSLLIALLCFVINGSFAASNGSKWRWRNNDGGEKTATWKGGQMQAISITDDKTFRFRAQYYHSGKVTTPLQYAEGVSHGQDGILIGEMVTITDDENTTNAFYLAKNTTSVTHGEATTPQLVQGSTDLYGGYDSVTVFRPGIMVTRVDTAAVYMPNKGGYTEIEWCIRPSKYAKPGKLYYFSTTGTAWTEEGAENPTLGISRNYAVLSADSITNFSITKAGHDLTMKWKTALQGHHHFEIEGRLDTAANWSTLANVPGGNITNYQTTIANAANGVFFYRVKLFDNNQNMSVSRAVKFDNKSADSLLSYSVHPSGRIVTIKWKTALTRHDHFVLQRSYDNRTFQSVATIPGGTGQNFSITLPLVEAGTIYMRMKLYDENNRESVTPTQKYILKNDVDLVDFTGYYNDTTKTNQLNFSTINEFYNYKTGIWYGFTISKYYGNKFHLDKYQDITKIPGQGFVKNKLTKYTFHDNNVNRSVETHYRLSYFKGNVGRYKILTIPPAASATAITGQGFSIYPNPASSGKVSFELKGYKGKTVTATLTNLYGKQISKETFKVNTNENYILSTNAASGTYVLNVNGEGVSKTGKVLLQ